MKLIYNISYEVAGLAFLFVIAIFFNLRYGDSQKNTRIFRRFFYSLIFVEALDVITAITISYASVIPIEWNTLANTVYFAFSALVERLLVCYIAEFAEHDQYVRVHARIGQIVAAVYCGLLLGNCFQGYIFSFVDGVYTHGSLYFLTYALPMFYLLDALVILLVHKKEFDIKVISCTIWFSLLSVSGMLLQFFFWQDVLMSFFGASLGVVIMMFTLETPDYIRLEEALSTLQKTNGELEHLRGNLQKEVDVQTEALLERQHKLEKMSIDTVQALAYAIDAKDEYTNGHSNRVAKYAVILARRLGWTEGNVEQLRIAAMLHDIGKIGVPDRILNKQGRLTDIEFELIKTHTQIGSGILAKVDGMEAACRAAHSHHERYDGTGYPDGLSGNDIPLIARLIGIADSFDAMNSKRVYRKKLSVEQIRNELIRGRGTQFDPVMLDAFLDLLDDGKLESIHEEENGRRTETVNTARMPVNTIYDNLTGLYEYGEGEKLIRERMKSAPGCLALIDIDHLRNINDNFGYTNGDAALNEIAGLIREENNNSIACRLGGDEFLYFISDKSNQEAEKRLNRIVKEFQKLRVGFDYLMETTLSIGADHTKAGETFENALARADKALYHMKQSKRHGVFVYRESGFDKRSDVSRDLEELVGKLKIIGDNPGTLQLSYTDFARTFEFISKMANRYEYNYSLLMITLVSTAGESLYVDNMEKAMDCMEESIHQVVRCVDVYTRYSTVQFLVMLTRVEEDDVRKIADRIFRGFYRLYRSDKIQPDYALAVMHADDIKEIKAEAEKSAEDIRQ